MIISSISGRNGGMTSVIGGSGGREGGREGRRGGGDRGKTRRKRRRTRERRATIVTTTAATGTRGIGIDGRERKEDEEKVVEETAEKRKRPKAIDREEMCTLKNFTLR